MLRRIFSCLSAFAVASTLMLGAGINVNAAEKIVSGDVNCDGTFDVSDVVLFQKWLMAVPDTELAEPKAADICEDGVLDVFDLCSMKRVLTEKPDEKSYFTPPIQELSPTLPSVGNDRILVFAISFPDYEFTQDDVSEQLQKMCFASADSNDPSYPFESISAYYERASYGRLHLTGDIYTYTAERPLAWYKRENARPLAVEVLTAFEKQVDYQIYNADNNKKLDSIIIVLPSEVIDIDKNNDGRPDWWYFTVKPNRMTEFDGLRLGSYTIVPYDSTDRAGFISKTTHELGHALGLPDYYKYIVNEAFDSQGLEDPAGYELMDDGMGDMSSFSKLMLGWLAEEDIQVYTGGTQTFSLTSMQYSPSCIIIPRKKESGYLSEYFMIEYITDEANNTSMGGRGIRIFHIEAEVTENDTGMEFMYNNNGQKYDKSNEKQRVIRLVNESGYFYPGKRGLQYKDLIDGSISGFHWYDDDGGLTVDTGLQIKIGELNAGDGFDFSAVDSSSSLDITNDPNYIKGSSYTITISET